jgi:cell fate (sporulation/competence/biofilm development) regulator YlbF (YheA/YmcA/DUF963 family)
MDLDKELEQAAEDLGLALRRHETVQAYLDALDALAAEPEVAALDVQYQETYQALIARQRDGETLPQDKVDDFYALADEVRSQGLVAERDMALNDARGFLLNVGNELSRELGLDYPTMVLQGGYQ